MRLLDLFCGAGGAAVGYHRAGFDEIVGVDINPQPHYPFRFVQADAMNVLGWMMRNGGTFPINWPDGLRESLGPFDAVHASPPCQAKTTMSNRWRGKGGIADRHPDLLARVRQFLRSSYISAFVLENVPGARSIMIDAITLSGGSFGLQGERPRLFEASCPLVAPHYRKVVNPIGVYGERPDGRRLWTRKDGSQQRAARSLAEGQAALGIDWMAWHELTEAIPPAYTEFIGKQLLAHLRKEAVA